MLPDKPEQVKDVSDRLWEAALDKAWASLNGFRHWTEWDGCSVMWDLLINHARCLIMLGEVEEPRDPLDEAIEAVYRECHLLSRDVEIRFPRRLGELNTAIRTHLGPFLKGEE